MADQRAGLERNLCYLTQDARRALDFLRGMQRQDTIATGGSINGIASRLKQIAIRVGNDPDRIRAGIEAEIAALHTELDALDEHVSFGSSGLFVALIQQRLAALHFYIPQSGVYDTNTGLALDAYHRLIDRPKKHVPAAKRQRPRIAAFGKS